MSIGDDFKPAISDWFNRRGLEVPRGFIEKVWIYNSLINEWSERMNLVSRNDLGILLERHILDSLTPLNEIPETGEMVDVGSGAGFPAIPIAIARPGLNITMVESRNKKAVFLSRAISVLQLENIAVWHGRIEDFQPRFVFDIATIRAVAVTDRLKDRLKSILGGSGKIIYYTKFDKYEVI